MTSVISVDQFRSVADFEAQFTKLFPQASRGPTDMLTLANVAALSRVKLRPRVFVDVGERKLTTEILGQTISAPVINAPITSAGVCPDAELAAAKGAGAAGTIQVISTFSKYSIEDVAKVAKGPLWFDLYILRDRELTKKLVQRAERAGYKAIVPVVDLNGAIPYPRAIFPSSQGTTWGSLKEIKLEGLFESLDPSLRWEDIKWLKSITSLPIVVKGIQTAEDAKLCVEFGADALVVSNHSGSTLLDSAGTADILPEVVAAVGHKILVLFDGGIRTGQDVLKALALGAKAVLIGKPQLWGLGVGGETGAYRVLDILRNELDFAMGRCGVRTIGDINQSLVWAPRSGGTP